MEQHTAAPLRYIPHRNGFNELSPGILHRVLSEQSIVYGTRRSNRRAGLLFIPLPRNRRAHTHTKTNKSRKIENSLHSAALSLKKKPSTATLTGEGKKRDAISVATAWNWNVNFYNQGRLRGGGERERSKWNGFTVFDVVATKGNSKVTLCDWQWFWRMCSSHNVKCTHTHRGRDSVCVVCFWYIIFFCPSQCQKEKPMQIMNELRTYTQSSPVSIVGKGFPYSLSFFFFHIKSKSWATNIRAFPATPSKIRTMTRTTGDSSIHMCAAGQTHTA